MTEADWLAATDPGPMLEFLLRESGKATERKLRLFAVACCRRVLHYCQGEQIQSDIADAVTAGERCADDRAKAEDCEAVRLTMWQRAEDARQRDWWGVGLAYWTILNTSHLAVRNIAVAMSQDWVWRRAGWTREGEARCSLLRCLFGNPFRPASALSPSVLAFNGGTVPKLAAAIYEGRAFDRLPVLADALEDAG